MREIFLYIYVALRAQILGFHGPFLKMLSRTSQRVSTCGACQMMASLLSFGTTPFPRSFCQTFTIPRRNQVYFVVRKGEGTTSPCGAAGGGRYNKHMGGLDQLHSLRGYCNMQHHVNEVVARVILVDSGYGDGECTSRVLRRRTESRSNPHESFRFHPKCCRGAQT